MVSRISVSSIFKKNQYVFIDHYFLVGYKSKDQQLIELQDNNTRQLQIQEEDDLRALEEQEQSIRQLEVSFSNFCYLFGVVKKIYRM